jgi:hypothetical protein
MKKFVGNLSCFLVAALGLQSFASGDVLARSSTGFAAFKVQNPTSEQLGAANAPTGGFYHCLLEDNGAVWNDCGTTFPQPNLVFDLPIDNTGTHTITIQPYWGKPSVAANPNPFYCQAFAYSGTQNTTAPGGSVVLATVNTPFSQAQQMTVNVANNGMSMAVLCINVPFGAGVANINWTQ